MSSNMTSTNTTNQIINEKVTEHLNEIEQELETSSAYFKPKPGKSYVIRMDLQNNKIIPIENERFKDSQGKPLRRYECKITHVNNGKEQLWDTSKTTCQQIIEQLRKGFTVIKVTRTGADRSTTYHIEGVQ
jgi:DNA-binding PadR family transcriptional regulator